MTGILIVDGDGARGESVSKMAGPLASRIGSRIVPDLRAALASYGSGGGAGAVVLVSEHLIHDDDQPREWREPDGGENPAIRRRVKRALAGTRAAVTAAAATASAVRKALSIGAVDILTPTGDVDEWSRRICWLLDPKEVTQTIDQAWATFYNTGRFGELLGNSPAMKRVFEDLAKVAPNAFSVLVTGDTGTGKELAAATIHKLSLSSHGPFIAVNCGAIPEQLMESAFFGHERGSFTGANRDQAGYFESAAQGTLFLDEVTEMPLDLQVKLLRVLETQSFNRIGSSLARRTDARIIAATNRDPEQAVAEGKLREDLYYRLNVLSVRMPPLAARGGDIVLIAKSMLSEIGATHGAIKTLSKEAQDRLLAHSWPGNVRELRNVIQRAYVMSAGAEICAADLHLVERQVDDRGTAGAPVSTAAGVPRLTIDLLTPLEDIERRIILATYEHLGGHKEQTAAALRISIKTLYNRLKEYGEQADSGGAKDD